MTGTRFYGDRAVTGNPLAACFALAVTAATEFITSASLDGPNADNLIYIRRPPAMVKIVGKATVAGKLTVRVTDGSTNSDYELSDNGSDLAANIEFTKYIEVPYLAGSPPEFLRISSLKYSATAALTLSVTELNGP